ncbi:hypothetical protein D3C81_2276380 [compost metagenome]
MKHLAGADDAFDQMDRLFRLLLRLVVIRLNGLDQKIAAGTDDLPDFLLLLIRDGPFAQLHENMNERAC